MFLKSTRFSTAIMSDKAAGSIKSQLMANVSRHTDAPHAKITIVGVGQVGMACAFSLITQHIASEICLVDVVADKLRGEMMDLQHGLCFIKKITVKADTDYKVSVGSKICIVTAGARQKEGESRLDLVQKNVDIFKSIIPQLIKYSPNTILLIVSNPVDVLTYVAWKISGLPKHRVIGTGTSLDSARFRFLISERLGISPSSCHGWVIGEHGDSSVAVWSGVNVAGTRLVQLNPDIGSKKDAENWASLHQQVITSALEIIKLKGYTCWAIGITTSALCSAMLRDLHNAYCLSVFVKGLHGIEHDVCLSLPAILSEKGVTDILIQQLTEEEKNELKKSADVLNNIIKSIKW